MICYYNEAPSALIRMVNSILDRTPFTLIEEILLIDDLSDVGEFLSKIYVFRFASTFVSERLQLVLGESQTIIADYAKKNWPDFIHLIRTDERLGLIRAKVFGSRKATGEV